MVGTCTPHWYRLAVIVLCVCFLFNAHPLSSFAVGSVLYFLLLYNVLLQNEIIMHNMVNENG